MINVVMVHAESHDDSSVAYSEEQIKNMRQPATGPETAEAEEYDLFGRHARQPMADVER
jgi:hypothetical protein